MGVAFSGLLRPCASVPTLLCRHSTCQPLPAHTVCDTNAAKCLNAHGCGYVPHACLRLLALLLCALQAVAARQGVFSSHAANDQNWNGEYCMYSGFRAVSIRAMLHSVLHGGLLLTLSADSMV